MKALPSIFSFALLTLGLLLYFRWALLNSHNYSHTPGILANTVRSLIVATLIFFSATITIEGIDSAGPFLLMFATGLAFGPSLNPPLVGERQYFSLSSVFSYILENVIGNGIWSAVKSVAVWLISVPISLIPVGWIMKYPEFSTMIVLTLVLGIMKFNFVMHIVCLAPQDRKKMGYPANMRPEHIRRLAWTGIWGLFMWISVCDIFLHSIPKFDTSELYGPIAFAAGIWLSSMFD